MVLDVLVFCCCITYYRTLSTFISPHLLGHSSIGKKSEQTHVSPLLSTSQAKIKVVIRLNSFLETLQKNPLQNSFSFVGRIKFFVAIGLKSPCPCWLPAMHPSSLASLCTWPSQPSNSAMVC